VSDIVYQIKDWDQHFENSRSRELDHCTRAMIPNKQDGMGLSFVLSQPEGLPIYAIWCLILGACSRQRRPRLGYLTDDGKQSGRPWTPLALSMRWRCTADQVSQSLQVLSSKDVGWITADHGSGLPENCQTTAGPLPTEQNGMEQNRSINTSRAVARGDASEPKTPGEKRRKAPSGPHAELIEFFTNSWKAKYGKSYIFRGGKDGDHIKWILEQTEQNLDQAKDMVRAYLADNDSFITKDRHSLGKLKSFFMRYWVDAPPVDDGTGLTLERRKPTPQDFIDAGISVAKEGA
jgi:hypothetical protein